jgi:ribosomal protein S18 acetylase RimI-like enzyme
MMSGMHSELERLEPDDARLPEAARTLAAAMAGTPWIRWALAEEPRDLERLYAFYVALAVRCGEVWITPAADAVACWTHSERDADAAALFSDPAAPHPTEREQRAAALLAEHAHEGPHWRLAAVAVAPDRQRRGLGTAVLQPRLAACDDEAAVATLETSDPANVGFYQRLGFAVTAELDIPAGPRTWLMRRATPPRP